jgi:tape measure domain-containing protein
MVTRSQELSVNITADSSDLVKATSDATKALGKVAAAVEGVDGETITVTPDLEMERINRDLAKLDAALDGLERRKAHPDVDMDITQLLRDEAKVRKAIDDLNRRRIEVQASVHVDTTGLTRLQTVLDDLDSSLGDVVPGLSGLGGAVSGVATPAAAAGAAFGTWELAQLAGDAETAQLQLSALTGSAEEGAQAFDMLNTFAKDTPFAFDQITGAAKQLVIAGKDVGDLPGVLTDLGNVSAATGADLEEVATIFQQMWSKGQVSGEEALQLIERGIPVWEALADAMGIPAEKVQELASAGKLGREEVDLLAESLGNMYPTAMAAQAESFNGQLSTLQDSATQLGVAVGTIVLPAFKEWTDQANDLLEPLVQLTGHLKDMSDATEDLTGQDLPRWISDAINPLGKMESMALAAWSALKGGAEGGEAAKPLTDMVDALGAMVEEAELRALEKMGTDAETAAIGMRLFGDETADALPSLKDLNDELADLLDSFSTLRGEAFTIEEAVVAQQQGFEDLKKAVEENGTSLDEYTDKGAANRLAIRDIIQAQDELRAATFRETGSRKEANKAYRNGLRDLEEYLIRLGFAKDDIETFVDQVKKTPRRQNIELATIVRDEEMIELQRRIERLKGKKVKIEAEFPGPADPATRFLLEPSPLKTITAPIDAEIKDLEKEQRKLNQLEGTALIHAYVPKADRNKITDDLNGIGGDITDVVVPVETDQKDLTGVDKDLDKATKDREVVIVPGLSPKELREVQRITNELARDRDMTITVHTVRAGAGSGGGTGGGGGLRAAGGLLAAPLTAGATTPYFAPTMTVGGIGGAPSRVPGGATPLVPKSTPVKVYLDGEEISDKIVTRVASRFTPAGRGNRRP